MTLNENVQKLLHPFDKDETSFYKNKKGYWQNLATNKKIWKLPKIGIETFKSL